MNQSMGYEAIRIRLIGVRLGHLPALLLDLSLGFPQLNVQR